MSMSMSQRGLPISSHLWHPLAALQRSHDPSPPQSSIFITQSAIFQANEAPAKAPAAVVAAFWMLRSGPWTPLCRQVAQRASRSGPVPSTWMQVGNRCMAAGLYVGLHVGGDKAGERGLP